MDYASYVRVLLSVWVGLGLGQLVQALNRLIRFKGEVKWDWLPLAWGGFAFLLVVQTWWAYFDVLRAPVWVNLYAFLLPLLVFVLLFLLCASALPDLTKAAEDDVVDLTAFYLGQRRYFFTLWGILILLAGLVQIIARGGLDVIGPDAFRLAALAAAVTLSITGRRTVHVVLTLTAVGALALYIVLFTLRLG